MGISAIEEVPISKISSVTTKETLVEIEAEGSIPVSSQMRLPYIHKLEDEHTMSEPTMQLQHQDRENEVVGCGTWGQQTEDQQSTDSNNSQAVPRVNDVDPSTQVHSRFERETKSKGRQEIEENVSESVEGAKEIEEEVDRVVRALKLTTSPKKLVLKLDLHDAEEKQKAMEMVSSLKGIDSIAMDMKENNMTVFGDIDPMDVVIKLMKVCHTEILTVEPAKEPVKKKDESKTKKKDDSKKDLNEQTPEFTRLYSDYKPDMTTHYQTVTEIIPEDTPIMRREVIPSSMDSQVGSSKSSHPTLGTKEAAKEIVEEILVHRAKHEGYTLEQDQNPRTETK